MIDDLYLDEELERQIVWLSICGTKKQKNQILKAIRTEMFCVHCERVFKICASLFLSGEEYGLPEVHAAYKQEYEQDLPVYFLDASEIDFSNPEPLIIRLVDLHQKRNLSENIKSAQLKLNTTSALDVGRFLASSVMKTIGTYCEEEEPTAENLIIDALNRYGSGEKSGYKTKLEMIDEWTSGLVPGRLYILGATKKSGKTRMAVSAMYGIASNENKCSIISLEMRPSEITDLIIAKTCRINSGRLENRSLTEADSGRIGGSLSEIKRILDCLHITSPALLTPDGLEAIIRFHVSLYGVKAIAIDFLTKILIDSRFENSERGKICSRLSALSRELNIAILLVVQLNKMAEQVDHPHIGMVEGSGQIAQFADVILILANKTRIRYEQPEQPDTQSLEMQITQRQGACSGWIPINAKLQILEFEKGNSVTI